MSSQAACFLESRSAYESLEEPSQDSNLQPLVRYVSLGVEFIFIPDHTTRIATSLSDRIISGAI